MNQLWNLLAVLTLFFHSSTALLGVYPRVFPLFGSNECVIDEDKSVTLNNFKYSCNQLQLLRIFSNLTAGQFPPEGELKGTILINGLQDQPYWNGKTLRYTGGTEPNERASLINVFFQEYRLFIADVHRTIAPIDNKPAYIGNYESDMFAYMIADYIREVQENLYLGIMTIRPFTRVPALFFTLEKL